MDAYRLLPSRWSYRPVLSIRVESVIVSALSEFRLELLERKAECDRFIYCLTCNIIFGRHTGSLHLVKVWSDASSFWLLYNRQPMLKTDTVWSISELLIHIPAVMKFPPVIEWNWIDHNVVMKPLLSRENIFPYKKIPQNLKWGIQSFLGAVKKRN